MSNVQRLPTGADLNTLVGAGFYVVSTPKSGPLGDLTGDFIVIAVGASVSDYARGAQIAWDMSTGGQYTRVRMALGWTAWSTGGDGGSVDPSLFDAAGTADAAVATLVAESDPFTQYLTNARGDARYDALNAASTAVAALAGATDPYTQYLTTARGDARYEPISAELAALAGLTFAADKLIRTTGGSSADLVDFTATGVALVGASSAGAARTALGLVIGTDVQPYDSDLAAIAARAPTKGAILVGDGTAWQDLATATDGQALVLDSAQTLGVKWATISGGGGGGGFADGDYGDIVIGGSGTTINFDTSVVTAFAKTFLDDANASAVRATLGLAIGTDVQAFDSDLTAWAAVNPSSYSDTATIAANYQPLSANLTSWAAVAPSSYLTTSAAAAAYQPLDSDLTAIAALTTDAFGLALLTKTTAAAIRTYIGTVIGTDVQAHSADLDLWSVVTPSSYLTTSAAASTYLTSANAATTYQPLDSDLTAIAALTTDSFGLALLTKTSSSAIRSYIGTVIGTDVQAHDADLDALAAFTHTKGNILVDTGSGWAVLGVGSNGNVLTADSTQTDGVHWVAPSAGVEIDATGFPTLTLKNTTSVGTAENVGTIAYAGNNASSALKTYASISGDVSSAVASAEAAALSFETTQAGALATRVSVGLGLYSASVSGGDKGADTANFSALYEGGVALSTKYALGGSGTPGRNRLINPMGRWFQAGVGTSVGTDGGYSFDQWYSLVQTVAVNTTALTAQENGMPYAMRFRQASTTQRWGFAQVLEADESLDLHGKACTFGGRLRCTNATTLRYAVLGWSGTANAVTRDIVLDWTNTTFTAGNFFTSTSTVVYATGSISVAASTYTDFSLAATIGTSCNNVIVFVWTDSTQASTCDLDASKMYFNTGGAPAAWEPPDLGTDLARCMRFYEKSYDPDEAPGTVGPAFVPVIGATIAGTLTSAARTIGGSFTYDVTKIKIPTVTVFSNSTGTSGKARDNGAAADVTAAAGTISRRGFEVEVAIGSGNTSANLTCCWVADARL